MKLSVVIPMFNEEKVVAESHRRMCSALEPLQSAGDSFELIFVNDGSRDGTARIVVELARADKRVRLIDFARNFGHQVAVTAGVDNARGDAVAVIDADMQDPPEVILEMLAKWREGFDVVYGRRRTRAGETAFKKLTAKWFYRGINALVEMKFPVDTGDFRLIGRNVAEVVKSMPERNRYLRGMFAWVGFRQTAVEYDRAPRLAGETKYSLRKMLKLAVDGIVSFSFSPLRILFQLGCCGMALGFGGGLFAVVTQAWRHSWFYAALHLSSGFFFTGVLLAGMGILGAYVARIADEVRGRPLYIIRGKIGFEEAE